MNLKKFDAMLTVAVQLKYFGLVLSLQNCETLAKDGDVNLVEFFIFDLFRLGQLVKCAYSVLHGVSIHIIIN